MNSVINQMRYKQISIVFDLKNNEEFEGKIELNDPNLLFDNSIVFQYKRN